MDLLDVIRQNSNLTTLVSWLELLPDFLQQLSQWQDITVLAPNNEAFQRPVLDPTFSAFTNGDLDVIEAIFTYHVLEGRHVTFPFGQRRPFRTKLQSPQYTKVTGGQMIEAIGAVGANGDTWVSFYSGPGDQDTDGETISYTASHMNFTAGVIQVVDSIIQIPPKLREVAIQADLTSGAGVFTGADMTGNLLQSTDRKTIDDLSNVTVFIPTNKAFWQVGSAMANLGRQSIDEVLRYHVIDGLLYGNGVSSQEDLTGNYTTYSGRQVTVRSPTSGSYPTINNVSATGNQFYFAGGVVWAIEGQVVLDPVLYDTLQPAWDSAAPLKETPFTSGVPEPTVAQAFVASASDFAGHTVAGNSPTSTAPARGAQSSGASALSAGAIAGIVVGAVAGLVIASLLVFWLRRRKKSGQSTGRNQLLPSEISPREKDLAQELLGSETTNSRGTNELETSGSIRAELDGHNVMELHGTSTSINAKA